MGKKVIHVCDLTKNEISEDDTVFTLKINKKGSRSNMTYELSSSAAQNLIEQLNGDRELDEGWTFFSPGQVPPKPPGVRSFGDLEDEPVAEEPSEERMIAEKKAMLRERGDLKDDEPKRTKSSKGCPHINKGRIETTMRKGKRFIYRRCKDCGVELPEMTKEERQAYQNGSLPADINMRDL